MISVDLARLDAQMSLPNLTCAGTRLGDEVVQVYHQVSKELRVAITKQHPVPIRRLVDFERVTVRSQVVVQH